MELNQNTNTAKKNMYGERFEIGEHVHGVFAKKIIKHHVLPNTKP